MKVGPYAAAMELPCAPCMETIRATNSCILARKGLMLDTELAK